MSSPFVEQQHSQEFFHEDSMVAPSMEQSQSITSNQEKINQLHARIKQLDRFGTAHVKNSREHDHSQSKLEKNSGNGSRNGNGNGNSAIFQLQDSSGHIARFGASQEKEKKPRFNNNDDLQEDSENIASHVHRSNVNQHSSKLKGSFSPQNAYINASNRSQFFSPKHSVSHSNLHMLNDFSVPSQHTKPFVTNRNPSVKNHPQQLPSPHSEFYPLEAKYLSIEDKFLKFKLSEQTLIKNIEAEIGEAIDKSKVGKRQHDRMFIKHEDTLEQTERNIATEVSELQQDLKELKKGAVESIDSKYKAIKTETIALITQEFESQCKASQLICYMIDRATELSGLIQAAEKKLQTEQSLRDQTAEFLINSFGDEIIKLEEIISRQKEQRIIKNDELLKMINGMEDQLEITLQKERKDMQRGIDSLEGTLEEVCYKIQERILGTGEQ